MKIRNIVLVSIFLLAILTIGAASANDELAVDEIASADLVETLDVSADTSEVVENEISDSSQDISSDISEVVGNGASSVNNTLSSTESDIVGKTNLNYEINYNDYYKNYDSLAFEAVVFDEDATGDIDINVIIMGDKIEKIGVPISSLSSLQLNHEFFISGYEDVVNGYGEYTINLVYSGDEKYSGFDISHVVKVNTYADIYFDAGSPNLVVYGSPSTMYIYIPGAIADGSSIPIYLNGKKIGEVEIEGEFGELEIDSFIPGKNTIKFNVDSYEVTRDVNAAIEIAGDPFAYYGDNRSITLALPDGAKGNFVVNVDGKTVLDKPLTEVNSFSLSSLGAGNYHVVVSYTGTDYDVEDWEDDVSVYPKVTAPKRAENGKDFNISIESGIDGELTVQFYEIVLEYDEEYGDYYEIYKKLEKSIVIPVEGGKTDDVVTDPVSFYYYNDNSGEQYNLVLMYYSWKGSDGIIFDDFQTARVTLIDESPDTQITLYALDSIFKETNLDFVLAFPNGATGYTEIYIDGKLQEVSTIPGIEPYIYFNLPDLSLGSHEFEFRYLGDDYFNAKTLSKTVTVTHFDVSLNEDIHMLTDDDVMTIQIMDNVSGFVTVYIDGKEVLTEFASASPIYVPSNNLSYGRHTYKVVYSGDDKFESIIREGEFNITNYFIDVFNYDSYLNYGDDFNIEFTGHESIQGSIILTIDGNNYEVEFVNGSAVFNISGLAPGNYQISAKFSGDSKCPEFDVRVYGDDEVTVIPKIVVSEVVKPGEDVVVLLKVPDDVTGTLTVYCKGEFQSVDVENGIAKINLSDLEYGGYTVVAEFEGDMDIESFYGTVYVTSQIVYPDQLSFVYGDKEKIISLQLPEDAEGSLSIIETTSDGDEVVYKTVKLVNGYAQISLDELGIGSHNLNIVYTGEDYNVDSLELYPFVEFNATHVSGSMNYGDEKYIDIEVPDSTKGKIIIEIGETQLVPVNNRVSLSTVQSGSYEVSLIYSENNDEEFYQYLGHIIVLKNKAEMNVDVAYGNTGIEVTLPDDATGEVVVDVDGKKYYGTVNKGKAVVTFDDLAAGEHNVSVIYSGNELYDKVSNTTMLSVEEIIKKASSITVILINGLNVTSVLKDEDGNPIAKMDVICSIGGENVTKTTNDKGEFTVTVKNNVVLSLIFEGDYYYNASEASITLKNIAPVKKGTTITVDKTFTRTAVDFPAGEKGYMFYFTLKDETGKVLANKEAKIGVSGKIYTVKTDKNGKAGLMINLANANVYTYAISFLGDDDYKASFAVSKLTVVKKAVTIAPAKTSYTFKSAAKSKVITATLKSTNKFIPSGKKVTLTVGGKTYGAVVAKNGKISLNIAKLTKKGTYKVTIKYAGDGTYKAAASKTITVKIA